jgi:hypothetical protein
VADEAKDAVRQQRDLEKRAQLLASAGDFKEARATLAQAVSCAPASELAASLREEWRNLGVDPGAIRWGIAAVALYVLAWAISLG